MDNQGNATCCSNDQVYVISYAERQTLAAVGIIVSFLGIIGNTLVIAAVILSKKLRTTTNVFILNLSVADLLTCGFVLPLDTVAMLGNHWPLPIALCKLAGFVAIVSVGASSNSMAFIAANRYILVTKSMSTYRRCFSRNKTLAAVVFIWLFSMTVAIVPQCTGLLKLGYQPRFSSCAWSGNGRNELDLYFFAMFYLVQCGCISWSYAGIAYHTYNHTRKVQHLTIRPAVAIVMDAQNQQRGAGHQPAGNKLQMEVTKNLFLVVCCLIVCTMPYCVALLMTNVDAFLPIATVILLSNSCVNPFLYGAKHPHFKIVFRCLISGKCSEIPDRVSYRFCCRHF